MMDILGRSAQESKTNIIGFLKILFLSDFACLQFEVAGSDLKVKFQGFCFSSQKGSLGSIGNPWREIGCSPHRTVNVF